jgi:Bacteriophage HK97-gp10, putative tail-component
MNLTVRMDGLDTLSLQTRYLAKAAQDGLKLGVNEAAAIFQIEAKTLVPVDTGRLQASIHTDYVENTSERQVLAVSPVFDATNEYGFEPPYARRIEFGFTGPDKLGRVYHQPAQPYMRPAFDSKQSEARAAIRGGVWEQVQSAMATASQRRVAPGRRKGQG